MKSWVTRLKSRLNKLNMNQDTLARKLGITRSAVSHYLAGRRVPPIHQLQRIATILKVDPAWLQYGISNEDSKDVKNYSGEIETRLAIHRIPILTWEQAAERAHVTKIPTHEIREHMSNFYTDKTNWYALRIVNDVMTSHIGNTKSFHEGDIIIVTTDKKEAHGDNVIALLPRSKEATFKQYVIDSGNKYLKPLNPQYPTIPIDESTLICGVITAHFSKT